MKIFIDNVNLNSSSGPNGFAKKISNEFKLKVQFEIAIGYKN